MAEVKLEGVRKAFVSGRTVAVDNFTASVPDGRLTCLLGPSGSGKTTVLRMLAGLERPDEGTIHIGSRDVTNLEPRERDVAMVFQGFALYSHMNVRKNVSYPLRVRGVPKGERDRRLQELASRLGIEDLLDRRPDQLSGGQQQRVALARTLIRQPQAALYDEPMTGLDARLRAEMRLELRRIQQDFEVTTLMVTHDHLEAMTMSDWIGVMDSGRLQQFGSPVDIFFDPANLFVATFVGEPRMNVFECDYRETDDGAEVTCPDFSMRLPGKLQAANRKIVMGIRPQHVVLRRDEEEEGGGGWPAKILISEMEGTEVVHLVELKQSRIKVKTSAQDDFSAGHTTWVEFPEPHLYFFEADGGRRLRISSGSVSPEGGKRQ